MQHTADRAPLWSLSIGSIEWPHVLTFPSEMFDAEDILLTTVSFIGSLIGRLRARLRERSLEARECLLAVQSVGNAIFVICGEFPP